MLVGNTWEGNYSRFTFDESDLYLHMLKMQGVPVLDDEFNLMQEILFTAIRRITLATFGEGSIDNGFKIVGTSASNNFTIKGGNGTIDGAGRIFVNGYPVLLQSDTTYSAQPISQAALTTPGGARTDQVYLDAWLDEIDSTDDADILDPSLGSETSRRLKLFWAVKVVEGSTMPASFTDGTNIRHNTMLLAKINRTATATITAEMVVDMRNSTRPFLSALVNKTVSQSIPDTTGTAITFDTVLNDDGNLWAVANPSRLTVPAGGYRLAKLTANLGWVQNSTGERQLRINKNNALFAGHAHLQLLPSAPGPSDYGNVSTGWVPVVAGDYFELLFLQTSGGALDAAFDSSQQNGSWFSMEVRK